jgi:glutamyl-tRNA synthetase
MKADAELAALVLPFLSQAGLVGSAPSDEERKFIVAAMPLVKERLKFLSEAPAMMRYLFEEPGLPAAEEFVPKKLDKTRAAELLAAAEAVLPSCDLSDIEGSEAKFRAESERIGAKFGDLMMPARVAITGARVSPPLFESMRLLGLEKSLARLGKARMRLEGGARMALL